MVVGCCVGPCCCRQRLSCHGADQAEEEAEQERGLKRRRVLCRPRRAACLWALGESQVYALCLAPAGQLPAVCAVGVFKRELKHKRQGKVI